MNLKKKNLGIVVVSVHLLQTISTRFVKEKQTIDQHYQRNAQTIYHRFQTHMQNLNASWDLFERKLYS